MWASPMAVAGGFNLRISHSKMPFGQFIGRQIFITTVAGYRPCASKYGA
jgi:hypothetical protein